MSRLVHCVDTLTFFRDVCPPDVDFLFLDPPYIGIIKTKWDREFTIDQLMQIIDAANARVSSTASMVICQGVGKHGLHPICDVLRGTEQLGWTYRNWITWKKRRGYGTQRNYLFTREELLFFSRSDDYTFHPLHTDELRGYDGWNKRYPAKSPYKRVSNVWTDIPELMRPKHEAEKPTQLMERVLQAHTDPGHLVADGFAGSGVLGEACRLLGRRYVGCDSDPKWAERANDRAVRSLPLGGMT